jgi:nitroreductase
LGNGNLAERLVFEMDVFEAIQKRHSVRAYLPDALPQDKLERILEAARLAPSAGNTQPWHFLVVTDQQTREKLSKGGGFARFVAEAPVVIVGCGNRKASPNWYVVDTAIALQNMVLAATAEGLGTCWVGSFDEGQVRGLLKIPEDFDVVALLTIGYSSEKLDLGSKMLGLIRKRKKLEEIASLGEFGKPFVQQP